MLGKAREIVTKELPKHWSWIIVHMETEYDVSDVDQSWHHKRPWGEVNGRWGPK